MCKLTNDKFESNGSQTRCYMYGGKSYNEDKNYHKVRLRCHYTGKYRCVAHSKCNLLYNVYIEITIISQPAITCSKLIIETLEQGVKYVQS